MALFSGLAAGLLLARPAFAEPRETTIGISQSGLPLVVYELGEGQQRVLVLGGQHGGPEANTVELAGGLLDYFAENPDALPDGVELDVLPIANPDGLAAGSRQFASGVDPNRNWGGSDWQPTRLTPTRYFATASAGPNRSRSLKRARSRTGCCRRDQRSS